MLPTILEVLPPIYHLLLDHYDELIPAVIQSDAEEQLDDAMYRVFWLVVELHFVPNMTRGQLADEIEGKFAFNHEYINPDHLENLRNDAIPFLDAYGALTTKTLRYMGL